MTHEPKKICSAPGCTKEAKRFQWGCDDHWWALPADDRVRIYSSQILNTPVDPASIQGGA